MKRILIVLGGFAFILSIATSCKNCYDCTYVEEYKKGSVTTKTETTVEVCSDRYDTREDFSNAIDRYESKGYKCR